LLTPIVILKTLDIFVIQFSYFFAGAGAFSVVAFVSGAFLHFSDSQPAITIMAPKTTTNATRIVTHFVFILFSLIISVQFPIITGPLYYYRHLTAFGNTLYAKILLMQVIPGPFGRLQFNRNILLFTYLSSRRLVPKRNSY
jgi:hypothetical protein